MGRQQRRHVGPYRPIDLLGRGGTGAVWEAIDSRHDRRVALKLLRPGTLDPPEVERRFSRAIQLAARIDHPHLVPILDYAVSPRPYIVMPLIEGTDLASEIRRGRLAPDRAVSIVEQVAGALHAVHQQGLVHRDVKPSNILLQPGGAPPGTDHAWLIDWGLAPIDLSRGTSVTRSGEHLVGAPAYIAPELLAENSATDPRADVYSLAVVLYECLSGHRPFEGRDRAVLLAKSMRDTPPPLPDLVPAGLRAVVTKGLAKRPDDRYKSAEDFAAAAHSGLYDSSATRSRSAPMVRGSVPWLWLVLLVAVGLGALIGGLLDPSEPIPFPWLVAILAVLAGASAQTWRVGRARMGGRAPAIARADRPTPRPTNDETKPSDIVELTVYTSNDNGEALRDAVVELLEVAGFEIVGQDDPVRGSFFQRLFTRRQDFGAMSKLSELADEAVRAAQLKYINSPRSESDEREANAIARLAEATSTMDEVVVCMSSILFIKTSGQVLSRVLTEREIRAVQNNPELMRAPQELLRVLSLTEITDSNDRTRNIRPRATVPSEQMPVIEHPTGASCPTCGYRPVEARERWQQHRDLSITWLSVDPDQPNGLVEHRHCPQCRPQGPSQAVACALCGDGPVISGDLTPQMNNGTPPESVLNWLRTHGWHDRSGVGMTCADHPRR